jgi:site-specific recombinase XerD
MSRSKSEIAHKFHVLSPVEVDKCLMNLTDTQHRAIFLLMTDLGMTTVEMLGEDGDEGVKGLYIQDINSITHTMTVRYRFKKEDRIMTRLVPMTPTSFNGVTDFLASKKLDYDDKGKIFSITDRMVRHFLSGLENDTKIDKPLDTATLRRTAIVNMLLGGLKRQEIEKRLGFLRPQEEQVIILSAYFMPSMIDFERVAQNFMYQNIGAMANASSGNKY